MIQGGQKGLPYADRKALNIWGSPVYGQLKDSLRTFTTAQDAYIEYQHLQGDDAPLGPFVPPRPPFRGPPSGGDPPPVPDDPDDDDLMGPPGPGAPNYGDLLQPGPNATDQTLLFEGLNPPAPPPPPPAPPPWPNRPGKLS